MATLPTRLVEIEFDAGVWTDVTTYAVSVATRRGRNRESGAFEAGTLGVVLRNDDRRFDPDHVTGPYYGKLRPNRRIRLRATYNAITYPVWQGYIDRITQVYGGPNDATAAIDATDIFKLLNRTELQPSPYAAEVAADLPALWWRFDDPAGTTLAVDSSGNARDGRVAGTDIAFGGAGLIARDSGSAAVFTDVVGQEGYVVTNLDALVLDQATPWAIEFWVRYTNFTTFGAVFQANWRDWGGVSPNGYMIVRAAAATNPVAVTVYNDAGTSYTVTDPGTAALATTYHYVITHDSDRFLRMYRDGALIATSASATTGTFSLRELMVGDKLTIVAGGGAPPNATVDEFAIYKLAGTTALSSARIAAHNTAGRVAWDDDMPGTRIGRILDLAAVPTADRNLDAGTTQLQATTLGGSALAYAQKVEETEAGRLFIAKDGKVRFIGRQAAETGAYLTSAATFVDDDSGAGTPYRFVSADVDEATIVTRATVARVGGLTVTFGDAAAQTEFKIIDEVHTGLLHDNDAYSRNYAEMVVNTHKTPVSRAGTVVLELPKDPVTMYPTIFALEIGDRVTYKRKPQNTGAVITIVMRVEAITHDTGAHYWTTSLQLSPFTLTATGTWWILGTAGYSELGQTTTLGL